MTAPNIEMIASSLRHCSINGSGRRRARRHGAGGAEGSDDSEGVTVELNSEVALPYHWQQCLDIRTGQVYYTNWEDGTRTTVDPRTSSPFSTSSTPRSASTGSRRAASASASASSSGYTSTSSVDAVSSAAWHSNANGGHGYGYGYDDVDSYNDGDDEEESSSSASSSRSSAISSTLSSFSPTDESTSSGTGEGDGEVDVGAGHVLVAAGCRACFMYFMVPKTAAACPKCGSSGLLHLGRSNGYA